MQWPFNIWATPFLTNYHFDKVCRSSVFTCFSSPADLRGNTCQTAILHRWSGRVIWAFSTGHAGAWFYQLCQDRDPFNRIVLIPVFGWWRFVAGVVVRCCSRARVIPVYRIVDNLLARAVLDPLDHLDGILIPPDPEPLLRVLLLVPRLARDPRARHSDSAPPSKHLARKVVTRRLTFGPRSPSCTGQSPPSLGGELNARGASSRSSGSTASLRASGSTLEAVRLGSDPVAAASKRRRSNTKRNQLLAFRP